MQPSLFVGSSTEALPMAEAVQRSLRHVADVTLWTQGVFGLNQTVFETLIAKAKYSDYAVFVFSRDDTVVIRNGSQYTTRDNVVFELGYFYAALGASRCFFIAPNRLDDFRVPTDLRGLIYAPYDLDRYDGDIDSAMGEACSDIALQILSPGKLTGDWLIYIDGSSHRDANGTFQIVHAGSKVTARFIMKQGKSGEVSDRGFLYEGRYISGQVVLHFEQKGAEDVIIGSMTIKVMANMSEMKGVSTYWHHDRAKMVTESFRLVRGA